MAEPAHQLPEEDRPKTRPDLGVTKGGGDGVPRGDLREAEEDGGFYNPDGGETAPKTDVDKSSGPGRLKGAEESPGGGSLYNPADRGGRVQRARTRFRSLARNKWMLGGVLGATGVIALIALLLIALSSLKVVQLAEHITAYQFARLSRNYAEHVGGITAEDTALSTADRSVVRKAYARYGVVKDKTWGSMWNKINNYRPDKIVENMSSDGTLDFKYKRGGFTSLWKKRLTAVVVNGKEIPVNNTNLFRKYIHPLQYRRDRLAFSNELNASLAEAMHGRSSIIRGAVAKSIRDARGINLQWWKQLTKYRGATEREAAILTEIEAEAEINKSINPTRSAVRHISDAEKKAQADLEDCMASRACVEEIVDNNGKLPSKVIADIEKVANSSVIQKAISFFNPAFTVGVPVCLIYDGSLQKGPGQGETINNSNAQAQRTFYAVQTAADQQKYGNTTGEAVGGMNWKTGDITKSIPEMRASGIDVNTSNAFNPQASTTGELGNTVSIFSFLPSPFSGLANSLADKACPLVTDLWFAGGVAIGNLIIGFFSGGTSTIATKGLGKALTDYLVGFAERTFTKKEAKRLGVFIGATEGLTILAKMLVAQKAGVANSGLATGPSFDDFADAGGNLHAQENSRGFYGRPLSNAEVAAASRQDQVFAAAHTSRESAFQRYFAISNPNSLLTRLGTSISARINLSFFSDLLNTGARILNPVGSLSRLFGSLNPQLAMAASSADDQNYGIVQWGWSNKEENLIKDNPDYWPLENQKILVDSGQSDAIEQKYGVCFDLSQTMGDMLTGDHPLITRADNGDITNSGRCSPAKLTYTNNEFGHAMVFRWRLEKNYETVLDQLENYQEVTEDDSGAVSTLVGNTREELAQQILDNDKISKTGRYVMEDLQHTAAGKPAYGHVNIALNILQFLADLGQNTSYTITSITGAGCGHSHNTCVSAGGSSNHYTGHAVDLGCPIDEAKSDEVAQKYGLIAKNERCENTPGNEHMHYSKDGY